MRRGSATVAALMTVTSAVTSAQSGAGAALSGNPGAFFGVDAYPPEAVRNHEQGRTVAELAIAADGHVTGCTVAESSGSASLDAATCRIALARIRFTPARDETGRPMASRYTLPVRWVLPDGNGIPITAMTMAMVGVINASGTVSSCALTINGQLATTDLGPCSAMPRMFGVAFAAQATGAQSNTIRAVLERRASYGEQPAPAGVTAGAVLVAQTVTRFRIDADGKPHGCRTAASDGDYQMNGDNPCRVGARFDLAGRPAGRLPIEASWVVTASYTRLARS